MFNQTLDHEKKTISRLLILINTEGDLLNHPNDTDVIYIIRLSIKQMFYKGFFQVKTEGKFSFMLSCLPCRKIFIESLETYGKKVYETKLKIECLNMRNLRAQPR